MSLRRPISRLGVDGHVLDGRYQGTRTWLHEILSRAPDLLPEVEFVVYTGDPKRHARAYPQSNVTHRKLPHLPAPVRIIAYWPIVIRKARLDGFLTQYISPFSPRRRQIVVVHDVLFETHPHFFPPSFRRRNHLLVRRSARTARQVVTVSEYSRNQIVEQYGVKEERIALVRDGVNLISDSLSDDSPAAELPAELAGRPYALMVGRLEPRKNLSLALRCLADLDVPDARLVVVGRDDFEAPKTLQDLADEPRALHLVDVPAAQLELLYRHAAVLLFLSLGEGWGIPVLEALAAGTPVIASGLTAIPEAGGPVAHYVDPTSPDALAEIVELLGRAFRGELALDEEATAAHLAGLTWDRSAEDFAVMIRNLSP